jgi:cyclic pyranopterin phosphate synthase
MAYRSLRDLRPGAASSKEFGPLTPFLAKARQAVRQFQIPGARGVRFISPISKHFCASCRRLRLTADGRIRPCLLSDTEIDIKTPMRAGCSDEELERLLRLSLEIKPERHRVSEDPAACSQRIMSRIGG